jgi:hypothetical protein
LKSLHLLAVHLHEIIVQLTVSQEATCVDNLMSLVNIRLVRSHWLLRQAHVFECVGTMRYGPETLQQKARKSVCDDDKDDKYPAYITVFPYPESTLSCVLGRADSCSLLSVSDADPHLYRSDAYHLLQFLDFFGEV